MRFPFFIPSTVLALSIAAVSGCGQTGDLYLPPDESTIKPPVVASDVTPAPTQTPTPAPEKPKQP